MKLYLTNGTFVQLSGATQEVCGNVTRWFADALPDDVLVLNVPEEGTAIRVQKRHIVQINTPL
jgi:hypothetical protein